MPFENVNFLIKMHFALLLFIYIIFQIKTCLIKTSNTILNNYIIINFGMSKDYTS